VDKNAPAAEPVSAQEARQLFAGWKRIPALVLAVSGGPDSVALLWLAARWRRSLKNGPDLLAVTVDHGLRAAAASEARAVKRLAASLGIAHRTLTWRGAKPKNGVPQAAREARYELLARAARSVSAVAVVTAHTQDDQAETILMRLSRGSGITGLAGMAVRSERHGIGLLRPFLDIPKARLVATLDRARIGYADDPTNHDPAYTRPRLRALMPALASEGADARTFARLAMRLARADAALERMTEGAERYLRLRGGGDGGFDISLFATMTEEIQVRLLRRALAGGMTAYPPELGQIEAMLRSLAQAQSERRRFKQSLAGMTVSVEKGRLVVRPAPPRRGGRS
jgi:tRNA(Ile)-lysidine synthase